MKKILILSLFCFSCLDYETTILSSDELTVEGRIAEGEFARIDLTNSLPFNGVIDSLEIIKSIESKAKVVLSDGEISEILTLKKDESTFPFLYYRSNDIKGEIGKEYDLSVTIRDKEFVSKTTIPNASKILSIDFLDWIDDGIVYSDFKNLKLTIANNTLEDQYYKVLIKTENEDKFEFADPFIFSTDDNTETFPVIITYTKNNDDGQTENLMKVNEIIELNLVAISKEQFDFWKSIKGDQTSILGNSSFANEVVTNISNGAFGYWSGENNTNLKLTVK